MNNIHLWKTLLLISNGNSQWTIGTEQLLDAMLVENECNLKFLNRKTLDTSISKIILGFRGRAIQ